MDSATNYTGPTWPATILRKSPCMAGNTEILSKTMCTSTLRESLGMPVPATQTQTLTHHRRNRSTRNLSRQLHCTRHVNSHIAPESIGLKSEATGHGHMGA